MTHADRPDRPRPQYGEYATPQEQRARIQQPAPTPPPAAPQPAPQLWGPPPTGHPVSAGRGVNRIVTIGLLLYGAINIAMSVGSFFDLSTVIQSSYEMMGITGSFTNVDAARTWGVVAAIVLIVGYVLTVLGSLRALRRGKLSWWIPLVGAAATYLVVAICVAVPMAGDPAFVSLVSGAAK